MIASLLAQAVAGVDPSTAVGGGAILTSGAAGFGFWTLYTRVQDLGSRINDVDADVEGMRSDLSSIRETLGRLDERTAWLTKDRTPQP